jgi:Spy/CpxP family protein refolding chaperone
MKKPGLATKSFFFPKERYVNKNRLTKTAVLAIGFIFLFAAAGPTRADSTPRKAVQASSAASPGSQTKRDAPPPDDFAGFNYTDEQRAEIDKIRQDTSARKRVVAKDETLNADQKEAMLLGYTRMEYGRIYRVLSPEQQKQVRQRMSSRRVADQAAARKKPPQN